MSNYPTILRPIAIHPPNNHTIRPRTSPIIRPTGLNRILEIWGRAVEGEALVVVVLMGVLVAAAGLAVVVEVDGFGGCGVDGGLRVVGSYGLEA